MADVLMVLTMVGFVLVCVAYVGWCERIIGPEPTTDGAADGTSAHERAVR